MPLLTAHTIADNPLRAARHATALLLCALLFLLLRPPDPARAVQTPGGKEPGSRPAPPSGAVVPAEAPGKRSWPVGPRGVGPPPPLIHRWEPPPSPYAAGHRGVDLAAGPGAPVRAATDGTVAFAGIVAGRRVLSVDVEGSGSPPLRITYEPVRARVSKGDRVTAGEQVGVIDTGPFHCTRACLHWGLRREDGYLDPLTLLSGLRGTRPPSRLLPVFGPAEPPEPGKASMDAGSPQSREWLLLCLLVAGGCWTRERIHRRFPGHGWAPPRRRRPGERAGRRPRTGVSPPHPAKSWPRRPP
ncbi:M23 family metallopeptidase [Streptomyces meridianus]|uniref:M23 family metallopeptidase n=1 Tax=Streptomyces meridianus TaxID=2938945 RepID=A0ABT0X2S1_9ACTN|nr:M23 family metallopeptidase [Streptomyces meridianus]MCM2576615.1 M23 family metallopeptidase [Streptomyces meridianus]